MTNQTDAAKRQMWQTRLASAKAAYAAELSAMQTRDDYYNGTRKTVAPDGRSGKESGNVRNIVYELIESQADATIPGPKVTPIHPEDEPLAKQIETMLLNLSREGFKHINDLQERTVLIQGGDFWHLEWNPTGGYHCTLGEINISQRHPRQVIPQPGVWELEQMDYVFLQLSQTKAALKRRYGVEVQEDTEQAPETRGDEGTAAAEDMVTQTIAYYKNETGGIGMFSWVGDQTLEDLPQYQTRQRTLCAKCGAPKTDHRCACGSRKFKTESLHHQTLPTDAAAWLEEKYGRQRGADVPVQNPDGSLQKDDLTGQIILQPGQQQALIVPIYTPNQYPLVMRRNLRRTGQFLGVSDVDMIADQQNAINKYGAKIEEKLLKGGSYVTLPQGVQVETTDRELKILRLKNPADKALIGVMNVQADTSRDQQMLETNYAWAKSTLGITDAFQGKYDASAISGTAKQFSANQSAGRLQGKRQMKNEAYAALYKRMFQFMLAYCDQPFPISRRQPDGQQQFGHFNRYDFLKQDAAGELYWNDEFIFEVDTATNLTSNRETLWTMMDLKYQAGGFGPTNDIRSQHRLWTLLAAQDYPYAELLRDSIAQQMAEETGGNAQPPTDLVAALLGQASTQSGQAQGQEALFLPSNDTFREEPAAALPSEEV